MSRPNVRGDTAQRVRSAIDRLDFVPNELASGLRAGRAGALGLVIEDLSNPFYSSIARVVEDVARERGHLLLIGSCGEDPIRERELVQRFLRRAVADGTDLEAREGMAMAATLGGLAFANAGVALVHAMEYPVGGAVHVSHGAGNGLLLPYVMRYNAEVRADEMASIGLWVGGPELFGEEGDDEERIEDSARRVADFFEHGAEEAIREVEQLRADIGIPTRLRDIGVTEEMLPGFADKAFTIKRLMRVNPRMPTRDEILEIYRAAY